MLDKVEKALLLLILSFFTIPLLIYTILAANSFNLTMDRLQEIKEICGSREILTAADEYEERLRENFKDISAIKDIEEEVRNYKLLVERNTLAYKNYNISAVEYELRVRSLEAMGIDILVNNISPHAYAQEVKLEGMNYEQRLEIRFKTDAIKTKEGYLVTWIALKNRR